MPHAVVEEPSMTSLRLAEAFLERAGDRLEALRSLRQEADFSDVIRESRDIVELCLRGMLRVAGIEVARWLDVGQVFEESASRLPPEVKSQKDRILEIHRDLSRDRQVAHAEEAGLPIEKLLAADADRAIAEAEWVLDLAQTTVETASRRRVPTSPGR